MPLLVGEPSIISSSQYSFRGKTALSEPFTVLYRSHRIPVHQLRQDTTEAVESWSSLVEEHALTDSYTLTREDARRIVEEELESAINAYLRANTTIHIMMVITPPERCVAQHVAMIEVPFSLATTRPILYRL
ncbi:MAG: hypothetical protein QGF12_02880 [SAR202 cluster bacterium]|nr:hypothetical protein [SAR202 cluster bacterium]